MIASLTIGAWVSAAPCEKTDYPACEKGCAKKQGTSCMRLGFLLMGIEQGAPAKDDGKARAAMEEACALKTGEACVYAGTMAEVGRGQKASIEVARAWWDKGCKQGHGGSCDKAAFSFYETGEKAKAAKYHELACRGGETRDCGALGQMEIQGDGIPAAPERGVKRLIAACTDRGSGHACVEAGVAYEKGEVGKAPDLARARQLYAKGCAAKQKDERGCAYAKR